MQTTNHLLTPVNPAVIIGCTFVRNSGGSGAALNFEQTDGFVIGCAFIGNRATGNGGAVRAGPNSIQGFPPAGNVDIQNSLFIGNSAARAGAVALETDSGLHGGLSRVRSSTFVGNSATDLGGGLAADVDVLVDNAIFWGNDTAGAMSEADQILVSPLGSLALDFSLVQGLTGNLGGSGNLGLDPLFSDIAGPDGLAGTLDDDARLTDASPPRDAGSTARLPDDVFDLDDDGDTDEPLPSPAMSRARSSVSNRPLGASREEVGKIPRAGQRRVGIQERSGRGHLAPGRRTIVRRPGRDAGARTS